MVLHFSVSPPQIVHVSSAPMPPQLHCIGLSLKITPIDKPKMARPKTNIDI
jgi:hypothetical protein